MKTHQEYPCSKEQFLNHVSAHTIEILSDNGVNRHLRFRNPNSGLYWFELVTWPGVLCIHGDCGTYVLSRLNDMFDFFHESHEPLSINPDYWSEKVVAMDTTRQVFKFSEEKFYQHVKERFEEWVECISPTEDHKNALWQEIQDTVLSCTCEGEIIARNALADFDSNKGVHFDFGDHPEWNCREFDYCFIWCCYAIVWGISRYEAIQKKPTPTH